jgi:hypothetical protein
MTRDGGDAVLARFTPRRYMLIMAVPMAVLAMLLLAGAITAAVNNQPIGVLWCVVILPVPVPLLVICTRLALLRVVLTATHLSTPRILHGWTTVPLAEIAGVGMHYHSGGRAASWCLTVWCAQGSGIGINVEPPNHSAPRGQRTILKRPNRPLQVNWEYLADSPAGRAAQLISKQVTDFQGPGGLLATQQRQLTARVIGSGPTAYWSPDGRGGVIPPPTLTSSAPTT